VIPSLLDVRRRNADAGLQELRLFEFARAFDLGPDGSHRERPLVTLLSDRPSAPEDAMRWMRGTCERAVRTVAGLQRTLSVRAVPDPDRAPWYRVEAELLLDGAPVASYGLLTPAVRATFGLEGEFAAAELALDPLWPAYPPEAAAEAMPAFPAIERDLSVIVPETATWSEIETAVTAVAAEHLERVRFVGTYRGAQTGPGRKSVTMRLVFRSPERTLRREDADAAMHAVAAALGSRLGATIRS